MKSKSKGLEFNHSAIRHYQSKISHLRKKGIDIVQIALLVWIGVLGAAERASAHHPMGGRTPANIFEGFMSGLAHPVIGFDHLAFVIAVGLLAASVVRGGFIPVAFLLTALVGTGTHLLAIDLPVAELAISGSVVIFGVMLILKQKLNYQIITALAAIAGLFHGYAYGEAIIGAEMSPLFAYLLGFTLIQGAIALGAMMGGKLLLSQWSERAFSIQRVLGLGICSVGVVFLASSMVG
ncbi:MULTISPECIES: HupE/UreJ family protein [unclassified Coleofasciculus]|uniref:HupE/UreJ family protein n=1 Tax=unclassified Coleofasciculus TaxID=2692782 RepID=UPI00187EB555|nr:MULTISPECIES: HupE/UreJ family protein [unclassified Coleofasciculus]MBE9125959.1 HupE/UreJ family protein [Coleofasciculus sp. LEGE 07081]MBE9148845.1 HupE/UreJ family protein [Coleofasciculus sp. LEGE 07092]